VADCEEESQPGTAEVCGTSDARIAELRNSVCEVRKAERVQTHYYLDAMSTFERVPQGVTRHDPAISCRDLADVACVAAVASVARTALAGSPPLDLDDANDARSLAVLSIPPQSRVLDIGSGSEAVARALAARGCRGGESTSILPRHN
jgi:hypothetical protein